MITKAKRVFTVAYIGLLILRWCGIRIFIRKIAHQLYGRVVFLVTTDRLDNPQPSSPFRCTISLASPDDLDELFHKLHSESPEGRYQLLVRKWYHEGGLGDCYISRATDTNEICAVRWLVTPQHIKNLGLQDRFPLDEDEITFENVYTFEGYRDRGTHTISARLGREIALQMGFQRTRGYIEETNIPQRKFIKTAGRKVCARILERHFLFHVTRKTLERYNPPIPMTVPPDTK